MFNPFKEQLIWRKYFRVRFDTIVESHDHNSLSSPISIVLTLQEPFILKYRWIKTASLVQIRSAQKCTRTCTRATNYDHFLVHYSLCSQYEFHMFHSSSNQMMKKWLSLFHMQRFWNQIWVHVLQLNNHYVRIYMRDNYFWTKNTQSFERKWPWQGRPVKYSRRHTVWVAILPWN